MSQASSSPRRKNVADYQVDREIGQGGMGVVYLAHQETLERSVVLKKIRRELLSDAVAVERFRREACAAAAIHHQNVVAVYDAFQWRNDLYIAQELVDGQDLRAIIDQARRLHPEIAALIALEVVRGLEEIHARGIVHRDLKPGNVLISYEGETKIADFGIALADNGDGLTRPGLMIGSLPYMSPEQILGEPLDQRSDLFLLGILLYEMIAGVAPFQESTGESTDTLLQRMQGRQYTPLRKLAPKAPRWIARLVRSCLKGRPMQRMESTTAVRRYLEYRVGSHSPADCRRRIAIYLRERSVLNPLLERTAVRPALPRPKPARPSLALPAWLPLLSPAVWRGGAVAAVLLITILATFWIPRPEATAGTEPGASAEIEHESQSSAPRVASLGLGPEVTSGTGHTPAEGLTSMGGGDVALASDARPVAQPALDPARLQFVAHPWAKVTVDDRPSFLTPRAQPVQLTPGPHRVVFTHPTLGQAVLSLDVQPGEERVVSHVFKDQDAR
jgi:serine/threonine protein kinase